MAKKRLRIKDSSGNVVQYDVAASDVTLQDGTDVETAMAGLGAGTVKGVKMNGAEMPENDGVVDLGTVVTEHQSLAALFGKIAYDNSTHRINFYGKDDTSMTTVLGYIDCSPFIVDGMLADVDVKNVSISGVSTLCMVFSFNTDAGQQDINIPVSAIFDASQYYTKSQADGVFQVKLVSGTNIKTVNNESILGEGNISIPKGEDGDDGKSAYEIAVDNGFEGTEEEWLASLKGAKGDTGNVQVDGNGNVLIVNDLTTGGSRAALSAEMGKQLAQDIDDIPVIDIHVDGRKLVINTNAALAPRVIVGNLSKSALSCRAGQTDTATFKVSGRRLTAAITAALSDSTYFSISPASISPSSGVVEETTLTVTYNPGSGATAGTSHSLTITIASDGVTYGTLQLTGTVAAAPSITLTPVSLTIGTESGQSGTGTINVKGTALDGDISLAISGSGFSLSDNLVSKAEAESAGGKDITVTFDGSADGATGTITASSTGATSVEASVSGSVRERLAVGGTITEGNLLYTVLTGQLTVSVQKAATAPSGAVTIPSTVYDSNGFDYSVVSIPTQGFSGAQITSISLPDTLKDIGKNAFFNCNSLTSIDLGDGVETIDDNAFYGTRLTSITFPDSLRGCKGCLASTPLLTTIQFGKTTAFSPPVDGNGIKVAMKNAGSTTSTTGSANTIETIICYATNPPTITDIPVNLDGATLKVPSGSITAYTNASKWNEIGTIEAI